MERGRGSQRFRTVSHAMDDYLNKLGLVRKQTAKDSTSLFRVVSEQIYLTQCHYREIQDVCMKFLEVNKDDFEQVNHTQACIFALSTLYKRDFVLYRDLGKSPSSASGNRFVQKIFLCESFGSHFDSIYNKNYRDKVGLCQSLVYEILYMNVFHMEKWELDEAVALIRNNSVKSPIRKFPSYRRNSQCSSSSRYDSLTCESSDLDSPPDAGDKGTWRCSVSPPFPYRVAKALDPSLYRNIEYDCWLKERRDFFGVGRSELDVGGFSVGAACLVRLDNDPHLHRCIIQNLAPSGEKAVVFVSEFGEMREVATSSLSPATEGSAASSPGSGGSETRRRPSGQPHSNPRFRYRKGKLPAYPRKQDGYNQRAFSDGSSNGHQPGYPDYGYANVMGTANCGNGASEGSAPPQPRYVYMDQNRGYPPAATGNGYCMLPPTGSNTIQTFVLPSSPYHVPCNAQGLRTDEFTMSGEFQNYGLSSTPGNSSGYAEFFSSGEQQTDMSGKGDGGVSAPQPIPRRRAPMYVGAPEAAGMYPRSGPTLSFFPLIAAPFIGAQEAAQVNYNWPASRELSGADLPCNDPTTLRFFFNLGSEYFRHCLHLQQQYRSGIIPSVSVGQTGPLGVPTEPPFLEASQAPPPAFGFPGGYYIPDSAAMPNDCSMFN